MRIVSLVPSVTETLSSWDRTPVACTRFCERTDLESVGGTKNPDVDRIVALAPDVVVVDAEENRREDYESLLDRGLSVHVLHVRDLSDVDPMMSALAARVDANWRPLDVGGALAPRCRAFIPIWRRPWMALGAPTYGSSLLFHLGVVNVFSDDGPTPSSTSTGRAIVTPTSSSRPVSPTPLANVNVPSSSRSRRRRSSTVRTSSGGVNAPATRSFASPSS